MLLWAPQVFIGWRLGMAVIAHRRDGNRLPNHRQVQVARASAVAARQDAERSANELQVKGPRVKGLTHVARNHTTESVKHPVIGVRIQPSGRLLSRLFTSGSEASSSRGHSWTTGAYVLDIETTLPMIISGTAGCGKSTFERHLLMNRLRAHHQVIIIDPKDWASQEVIRSLAEKEGFRVVVWGEAAINILPQDIERQFNVLKRFLPKSSSTNYYSLMSEGLIESFLQANGPVRDFEEFFERFPDWEAWAPTEIRQHGGRGHSKFAEHVHETAFQLKSTLGRIPNLSRAGISVFDQDWDLLIVPAAETVTPGAHYLVAALTYLVRMRALDREQGNRKMTYLVDEAVDVLQQVDVDELPALMEQLRSTPVQLVIAVQDVGRFPDRGVSLLASGATLVVMRQRNPEPISTLIGTYVRPETTQQVTGLTPTGLGSVTLQNAFRVDPDELRYACTGEAWLVEAGQPVIHFMVLPPTPNSSDSTLNSS